MRMRPIFILIMLIALAGCGGAAPSALTADEARLAPADHVTVHMCRLMIDRVFDLVEAAIPQDAYGSSGHGTDSIRLREQIEKDRARLEQPAAIDDCAARFDRSNYDCVMRNDDTRKVKDCLPGVVWVILR